VLEDYWEEHKAKGPLPLLESESFLDSPSSITFKSVETVPSKPKGHNRKRSASDGAALLPPGHNLSAYHPAWSLLRLLETFGPLIFPIYRAALLRKRILITAHAPVEETCNFGRLFAISPCSKTNMILLVYDISVLSNVPLAVSDLLASTAPPQRLRPLFSIGVHDIPLLEEDLRISKAAVTTPNPDAPEMRDEPGCGWIACTTDSILAMKSALYDVLITMPPPYSEDASEKVWPKVESPQGTEMKATQRDLRRYKTLRWGLSRQVSRPSSPLSRRRSSMSQPEDLDEGEEVPPRISFSSASLPRDGPMLDIPDTDNIIEPLSWSALAYSGFMWWASAGEQRIHSDEECDADAALLSGLSLSSSSPSMARPRSQSSMSTALKGKANGEDMSAKQEMAIIAYFHRLTTQILSTLSDIVDATDSDDERENAHQPLQPGADGQEDSEPTIYISSNDIANMGLDIWSATDHMFIEEVAKEYFGCRATVEGRSVDVCGIRIC
jgi:hypothetical protein